jgi:hypothetical protein
VPLALAVTSLLPVAVTGEVIVIVELPDEPAAMVSDAGAKALVQPVELPAKFAVRLKVRGLHKLTSGLVTVTV